ncbi:PAS domain-containing sensor histidine kinase [Halovenus salina]|uniref:histidine kinase n=1 Tax=Halovenus salina TaxID=1510225 RepID=A0ABD5W130_9EURY|nr:PAS domain-containing sensor histidine kinase [Halovenus salina]
MTSSSDRPGKQPLINEAPVGIFQVDKSGRYTDVNPAGCELLGYSRDELLDMSITDVAPNATNPDAIPHFSELQQNDHSRAEGTLLHKEGHEVHVIIDAVALDETEFVAYVQDITERKKTEHALNQAREQLRQVIDLIPDPIFVKNRDEEILLSNEANAKLVGATTPEEVENKPEPEFFPESDHYEMLRQRDTDVIESGESTTFEEELTSLVGEKRIVNTTRIPFKDPKTGEKGVLGYARDITEQREYEQKLEEQRDNLEVLNQVLRHDIRNDLQLVTTYAELLAEECDGDEITEYINTIQENADHAVGLTETAREIADVMISATPEGQQVNLQTVIKKEVSEVQSSDLDAAMTYDTTIPPVTIKADDMLSSVFRNLLENAIKHNDKTVPEVTVSATEQDDVVTIRIADNGPGIPDDQKETIFGKGNRGLDSAGTGMGLYLVDTLATRYGGEVWVEDNDPEGAVFVVTFPTAE